MLLLWQLLQVIHKFTFQIVFEEELRVTVLVGFAGINLSFFGYTRLLLKLEPVGLTHFISLNLTVFF